ncbi:MAG: NAD-dependent epimerase/dehydratase family protein [Actinobacteria bacterium]|nr:NAD-dependent epimerase/dehydratase family protein [Actinomycetota bacterium]
MPPPDTLLTGATGFIGGALLRRLTAGGRRVTALVRSGEAATAVAASGAAAAIGDVRDPVSLRAAMDGCEVVYHAAGVNAFCLRDPSEMLGVNVEGSVEVIRAAADTGVRRVVYTSSAAAIGEAAGTVGSEASPHRGGYHTAYERSKHEAEVAVLAEAGRLGVDVVAVSPSSVQGPGRTGGTARILIGYLTGRLRFAVDTTLSIVYIDDCVEGHLLAEDRGVAGERYLLNGAVLRVAEAIDLLAGVTGVRHRVRYLPGWVALAGGHAVGGLYRLLRRGRAPFCAEMARALVHGHTYDGSKAARDLGLTYTDPGEALARTAAWLEETGLLD